LRNQQALGLWIEGDGQGEIVAVRLESPQHIAFGAVADRYVDIDFTGKRYVSLVETESARWSDYTWNDGKSPYNVYRETIDFGAIDSVSIWCQNLPPGKGVKVGIGPVKALPMLPAAMKNPMLVVNGVSWTFPVELSSGSWIECNGPGDCTVYGAKGEILEKILPSIQPPKLPAGRSELRFSCESGDGPPPRAKVTVFNYGEEI
jgi:hypothetical protein